MALINFTAVQDGTSPQASQVNNPLTTIYNEFNGNISSVNLASNAVTTPKIADSAVTPAKLVAGTGASWAWQDWTPTYTNITVGNGTATGKYTQVGKTIIAELKIVAGTTTSFANSMTFTLPVTAATRYGTSYTVLGDAVAVDPGVGGNIGIVWSNNSTTDAEIRWDSGSSISSTFPFTESSGDVLSLQITYEAA